jgi:hypothetical protein
MSQRSSILAAVVVLAFAVRLAGIDWGLPWLYEEATPLERAWDMAGWGERHLDLNPHFFHYPSLTFYTHLGAQAALCAAMVSSGAVESVRKFRIRYHTEPLPHVIVARLVSVLFALVTVAALAMLPSVPGAAWVGTAAALLLAVNVFHVSRSQMIEVDVPLTAFVTVALVALTRLAAAPRRRRHVIAGILVGLAASTKYTGALLLVPLVAAHLLARARRPPEAGWRRLGLAAGVAAAVFVATSPYTVLDFASFRGDLALERAHMRLGHFGGAGEPALVFYLRRLGGALVGWPLLALAAAGVVMEAVVRRRAWAIVTAVFLGAYVAAISSFATAADRYALPLIPALAAFAAASTTYVAGGRRLRAAIVVAALAVMLAHNPTQLPAHRARQRTDSRTIALEWIERNVEPGSLVVTEAYGPPLFGPLDFWDLTSDIRNEVYSRRAGGRFRGVLPIPLFQSQPEATAPYYDLELYRGADIVVTTASIRARYAADPGRFPVQNAFYDTLEAAFELAHEVEAEGTGPRIRLYRNPAHSSPFAARPAMGPPRLRGGALPPRWRAWFYYRVGLNHEAFGHLDAALASYRRGWPDAAGDSETYRQIAYGVVRTLHLLGREDEIPGAVRRMAASAPSRSDVEFLDRIGGTLSQ